MSDDAGEGTGGAAGRDETAVAAFVEHFAQLLVEGGMARMPARVFARLLVSDAGRLTAAELGEQLRASPAAISGAIRYLEQVQLATRRRAPGSRRDFYEVRGQDVWYEVMTRRDQLLGRWVDGLSEGLDALGENTPAGRRLLETRDFMAFMLKELPEMMERWREYRATTYGDGAPGPEATGGAAAARP
jgi:DNA-binding transcriptional regulator GbsR (MarR family)